MEYAKSLRNLKTGWTLEQRKTYFQWFQKAANFKSCSRAVTGTTPCFGDAS